MDNKTALSVVIPLYNEKDSLTELHEDLTGVLENTGRPYEIVFVDDGSNDGSSEELLRLNNKDERVKIVSLLRNFGQQAALMAGFKYAKGEVVITMDADLQNDPADIPKFIEETDKGRDAVYGRRDKRGDPLLSRKLPSYIVNLLISRFSGVRLHDYGCNFKAFTRDVVEYILDVGETGKAPTVLGAMGASNVKEIPVSHSKRAHGESRYSLNMLIALAIDLVTGYSTRPFLIVGVSGIMSFCAGALMSAYYIVERFLMGIEQDPRMLVLTLLLLFMGLQMMILGFLGEYIIRIYKVVEKKPMYKVRRFIG